MSFIIRIAVLCLLLAAIPCIAAASDSGDHGHGHDTGDASGSDHSAVDSGGNLRFRESSDSGGTSDSGDNPVIQAGRTQIGIVHPLPCRTAMTRRTNRPERMRPFLEKRVN